MMVAGKLAKRITNTTVLGLTKNVDCQYKDTNADEATGLALLLLLVGRASTALTD